MSWRLRNNAIATHSAFHAKVCRHSLKTTSKRLRQLLTEDEQSEVSRSMVRSLKPEAERIDRSQQLV